MFTWFILINLIPRMNKLKKCSNISACWQGRKFQRKKTSFKTNTAPTSFKLIYRPSSTWSSADLTPENLCNSAVLPTTLLDIGAGSFPPLFMTLPLEFNLVTLNQTNEEIFHRTLNDIGNQSRAKPAPPRLTQFCEINLTHEPEECSTLT